MITNEQVGALFAPFLALYPHFKLDESTTAGYAMAIGDLEIEDVAQALKTWTRTSDAMPTANQIREAVARKLELLPIDPDRIWAAVQVPNSTVGRFEQDVIDDHGGRLTLRQDPQNTRYTFTKDYESRWNEERDRVLDLDGLGARLTDEQTAELQRPRSGPDPHVPSNRLGALAKDRDPLSWSEAMTEDGERHHRLCKTWHKPDATCPFVTPPDESEPDYTEVGRGGLSHVSAVLSDDETSPPHTDTDARGVEVF